MEPGTLALHNRSAPTQDFKVKSSVNFQQLRSASTQNQSYMTTNNSQHTFPNNIAFDESPMDMNYNLPRNRNEFLASRLPPAISSDVFGYGNPGSSLYSPGSFLSNPSPGSFQTNPSLGYMKPSSKFDKVLPSQYNGGRNLSSIQQVSFSSFCFVLKNDLFYMKL